MSYPRAGSFGEDRTAWQSWSKDGMCFELAFGIIYPMVRMLYPTLPLAIWEGDDHCFVISPENIFDPMYAAAKQEVRELYETEQPIWEQAVQEEDIAEFWTMNGAGGEHDALCDLLADLYDTTQAR